MNYGRKLTAMGLTASMLAAMAGHAGAQEEVVQPEAVERSAAEQSHNILFITVDQEHYFPEYPEGTSFKARQLLAELGTTFEKHYACSNMSTSSRSVMFTGRHIPDTGMIDNTDFAWQGAMDDSLTTVGDMMREAGYYTALKGKWHLGDASILHEGAQLTDLESYGYADWGGTDYIGSVKEGHEMDPVIVSETLEWLDSTGKRLNEEGRPFFLNVNLVNPHDIMNYDITGYQSPFMALSDKPEDPLYDTVYDVPIPPTWDFDFSAADVPDALRIFQGHWGLFAGVYHDADVWQDYQNYYFNCIQDSDNNLLNILNYLTENNMLDNTVIVFTADHGEMQGSHGLKGKGGFLYENNIHVPLIIVHPDHEGGRTVSAVTSHVDLAPTLVDMANLSEEQKNGILSELPGKSLLPLMEGSQESVRDASLFCFEMLSMTALQFGKDAEGNTTYSFDVNARGMVRGITTKRYKFVRYFSPVEFNTPATLEELFAHNDVQLFDLDSDPDEMVNLAADPEANADLIMQLNTLLNETIRQEIGVDDGMHVKKVLKALQEKNEEKSFAVSFADLHPDPYEGLCYNSEKQRYEAAYMGSAIKPAIKVSGVNGLLTEGIDYSVTYTGNTNAGQAKVTVNGKGNFSGKTALPFTILPADLGAAKNKGLLILPERFKVETGKKLSPVIFYGAYQLKSSDYTLSNTAAIKENTTVNISGKKNFTGELTDLTVEALAKNEAKAAGIKVSLKAGSHVYNGSAQELTCALPSENKAASSGNIPVSELTVTAGTSKTPLIKDQDYSLSYSNNIHAGTAKLIVNGKGSYTGSITKTFRILPDKSSAITAALSDPKEKIYYDPKGAMPAVTVSLKRGEETVVLRAGKDYKVTYSGNKKVGNNAGFTVSFLGDYTGHKALPKQLFTIEAAPFTAEKVKLTIPDLVYTKADKYRAAPYVSINGAVLAKNNYTVEYVESNAPLKTNEKITLTENETEKTITVKVTGKGNYAGTSVSGSYRVIRASSGAVDLTKTKIVSTEKNKAGDYIALSARTYTGKEIKPGITVLYKNGKNWEPLDPSSYTVNYLNNVARGKAVVLVTGKGTAAVGSRTAAFTIKAGSVQ